MKKLKCPYCQHALTIIDELDSEATHYCKYCDNYWLITWLGVRTGEVS